MPENDTPFRIGAEFNNLAAVKAFVCRRAEELEAPELLWSKLELVMEEIFLNIVHHATPKTGTEIEVNCSRLGRGDAPSGMFCVTVQDWGPPFNPLEREDPVLEQDLNSRTIGGLGIYLITQMADHCAYARQDESNIFTVCFSD